MQLVKIILHGSLKGKFSETVIAADCAADAIEGWGRQSGFNEIPMDDRPLVQAVDHETKEDLYETKELTELHLVPAMLGGGGGIIKVVIGAVLIVVGVLLLPTNPALGAALIGSGIGFVVGGVMELFMKSPSISKSKDPDPSKYIGSGKNSTAIGTPIGFGGGRMMIGGQFLSLQVNAIDMVYGSFPQTPP